MRANRAAIGLGRFLALAGAAIALAGCGTSDDAADERLDALLGSSAEGRAALDEIVAEGDRSYIAPLIEVLRADELGLSTALDATATATALDDLSGKELGADWPSWATWYADTELEPPPGFSAWKGRLLSALDPGFEPYFAPGAPSRIRVEEIVWGGVRKDGIPALDDPRTLPVAGAGYLARRDPVFGVALNGEARAYPLRILDWHEMANDVVGGVPVSLAYCTLCGAGVLYETRTPDHGTLTFGSSGFLMRSNKLMYDRQTDTLWNQLTGEPVHGELAGEQIELDVKPLVTTTWERWRRRHPDTTVLDIDTGFDRPYRNGAAYGDYFESDQPLFPVARPGRGLQPKQRVFALRIDDRPKAYPLDELLERRVVNDELGSTPLVVAASGGRIVTDGTTVPEGEDHSYESGAEVRAYERGRHRFRPAGGGALRDERGRRWRISEDALRGPGGERLERLGGHLAYAFGWLAYHPRTEVLGAKHG